MTKKKRSHGEGSITQRADGTWTARIQVGFKDDGKPKIKAFYGKQRKDVVKKLDRFKEVLKDGLVDEDTLPDFDVYISEWLYNVKANDLKDQSFDRLESTINNHIIPTVGHLKLNEINDVIVQTELINKKVKVLELSYSSVKKIYDALNACFKYAVSRRDLRYNPMNTVTLPKQINFETKEIEIFTDEEIEKIINVANLSYSNGVLKYRNGWGIVLMIYTGMRVGEALALKWTDFNANDNTISVVKNLTMIKNRDKDATTKYKLKINDTVKTKKSERIVPLSKRALEAISHLKETSSNYIISTRDGNPVRPRNLQNTLDDMLKDAGIEHKSHHVTRHTFASMLFRKGADVKTVSELLGHSDTRITYDTYIHLIKEQKASVVALLD